MKLLITKAFFDISNISGGFLFVLRSWATSKEHSCFGICPLPFHGTWASTKLLFIWNILAAAAKAAKASKEKRTRRSVKNIPHQNAASFSFFFSFSFSPPCLSEKLTNSSFRVICTKPVAYRMLEYHSATNRKGEDWTKTKIEERIKRKFLTF